MNIKNHCKLPKDFINLEYQTENEIRCDQENKILKNTFLKHELVNYKRGMFNEN